MQTCQKCKISVRGNKACCPLCEGRLSGTPEDPAFPVIPRSQITRISLWKLSMFLFICYEISMALVYIFTSRKAVWVPVAMLYGFCAIIDIALILYVRSNILKMLNFQTYAAIVVVFIADVTTGFYGWSLTWVIPALFAGLGIVTLSISAGLHLRAGEYMLYIIFNAGLSFLQVIFILNGMNHFRIPAIVSIAFLLVLLSYGLIFRTREFRDSTSKFFNT
ncbi:MAG: hypothetical protein K5637_01650 [Lachnospiraceae bacterium]|nr:hypothetical protein [Lachnospiraceae bacterium]